MTFLTLTAQPVDVMLLRCHSSHKWSQSQWWLKTDVFIVSLWQSRNHDTTVKSPWLISFTNIQKMRRVDFTVVWLWFMRDASPVPKSRFWVSVLSHIGHIWITVLLGKLRNSKEWLKHHANPNYHSSKKKNLYFLGMKHHIKIFKQQHFF